MALKAGYVGVKRWLYEKLQATTSKNVRDIADIWADNNITGVKNFLAIPIKAVKATNQTGSWAGNVYTINGGTFTFNVVGDLITDVVINGTFTADTTVATNAFNDNIKVAVDGDYIPSGITGGSATTYSIIFNYKETLAGSEKSLITLYNDGNTVKTIDSDWLLKLYLVAKAGTYNNVSLKPMIRLASDPDATYVPYAMTNQELTKAVYFKGVLPTGVDLNDVKEAGIYSFTSTPTSAPTGVDNAVLIVTPVTTGNVNQTIIKTASTKSEIYSREYGGSPASWFNWYKYTGTAVSQSKAPEDIVSDPELLVEEPEVVVKKSTKKSTKKEVE